MEPDIRLLTTREAAEVLGCSLKSLQRRIERRAISCGKVGGRWQVALDMNDLPSFGKKASG